LFENKRDAEGFAEQCEAEGRRRSVRPWGARWKVEYERTLEEITAGAERNKRHVEGLIIRKEGG